MTSDVPTAVRIVNASAIASAGTTRKPPPTPKSPVTKPTPAPAARSRGRRSGGHAPVRSQGPSGSGSSSSALRHIACAAATITSANAASSSRPPTCSATSVPAAMPGIAAAVNEPAWRQQTRPARACATLPAIAPAATTSSDVVVASGTVWPMT